MSTSDDTKPARKHDGGSPQDRRRTTSTGGRGVANLSATQLAKKRENDKLAQRQIRKRTKETIEELNQRIRHLEEQSPHREKSSLQHEGDRLRKENEAMRAHFQHIASIAQPYMLQQSLPSTLPNSCSDGVRHQSPRAYAAMNHRPYGESGQSGNMYQMNMAPVPQTQSPQTHATFHPSYTMNPDPAQWLQHQQQQHQQQMLNTSMAHQTQTALGTTGPHFGQILSGWQGLESMMIGNPGLEQGIEMGSPQGIYPWTRLPVHAEPACELDKVLLAFLEHHQRAARTSKVSHQPAYPSIASLLNEPDVNKSPSTLTQPLSRDTSHTPPQDLLTAMTDLTIKFPSIAGLPTQVGTSYLMFTLMRWQIYPTRENYEQIPDWYRPTETQLAIPHAPWVDLIQWPALREHVIRNQNSYYFPEFTLPYTCQMSINWKYDDRDCIITQESLVRGGGRDARLSEPIINPVFERHLRELKNWSVGPALIEKFPEFAPLVRVEDRKTQIHGSGMSLQHDSLNQMHNLAAATQQFAVMSPQHGQYMHHDMG